MLELQRLLPVGIDTRSWLIMITKLLPMYATYTQTIVAGIIDGDNTVPPPQDLVAASSFTFTIQESKNGSLDQ